MLKSSKLLRKHSSYLWAFIFPLHSDATSFSSSLYHFYLLCLTFYSHPRKWVVFCYSTVAFKDSSVIYSSKIGYVFSGRRSLHSGTEKWKKNPCFCAISSDLFYSAGLSYWPGSLLCPVSQDRLAAKGS